MSLLAALTPLADSHGPGWWIVLFPIGWSVFFLLVFFVVRRGGWRGCGTRYARRGWGGAASPLEILDRRFADGQIDVEEYHERRETLAQRIGQRAAR